MVSKPRQYGVRSRDRTVADAIGGFRAVHISRGSRNVPPHDVRRVDQPPRTGIGSAGWRWLSIASKSAVTEIARAGSRANGAPVMFSAGVGRAPHALEGIRCNPGFQRRVAS
jgi:hypothetical protein